MVEEAQLPVIAVQVVAQDVDAAVVAAHAEVAVRLALPAVEDFRDAAHPTEPAEAHRNLAAPRLGIAFDDETRHRDPPRCVAPSVPPAAGGASARSIRPHPLHRGRFTAMSQADWIPGRATPQGTRRFEARFPDLPGHFRCPDRLCVSSFGLGTRAGEIGGGDDLLYRQAVPELLTGGVNLFDTALSDRMQTSERALGVSLARAIREGVAARDEIVVVTKGGLLTPDPDLARSAAEARRNLMATYVETGLVPPERLAGGVLCLEPAFLRDQILRSRRNLRLETLDVWCLEQPELALREFGGQEFQHVMCRAFEALEQAVCDGQIAAYGLCTWDGLLRPHSDPGHLSLLDLFQWALDVGGADHHLRAIQLPYSLAMAEALRLPSQLGPAGGIASVLAALRGTGSLVLASAPLAQGRAFGRLPDFVREYLAGPRSDAQLCLQFARSSPGITAAIVGMRDAAHIDQNLALARVPVASPEAIEALFKRAGAGR